MRYFIRMTPSMRNGPDRLSYTAPNVEDNERFVSFNCNGGTNNLPVIRDLVR